MVQIFQFRNFYLFITLWTSYFIIYFPFNFIKGIITGIVYYLVRPVEKDLKVNILKKLRLLLFFIVIIML